MLNISYAQNFEDILIYRLFKGKKNGVYIDVGAAHPTKDSVTKFFYERGWSGVNLEPNTHFYKLLQRDRPRDVNLNCAAYSKSGEIKFTYIPSDPKISFVGDDPEGQGAAAYEGLAREIHQLNAMTLTEVYQQFLPGKTVDFLKVDVEGAEIPVLQGIDFNLFKPRLLVVESVLVKGHQMINPERNSLLAAEGYREVYFDGCNSYYAQASDLEAAKAYAVPLNAADDPLHYRKVQLPFLLKVIGAKFSRRS